ncbi:MAG: SPASM domain-containing protein, partial [Syntrophaceae bacterium]|nr:SPASM domain-containing protein [Syntrophaceae bacterium]
CPVSELRTLICPSGVFICPYWRGKENFRIGDAQKMSFAELWNGKRRKEVMAFANPSQKCMFHCLRHESNFEILRIIKDLKDGKDVDVVDEYDRFI